jgi:N-methylhydantoinase A/oxoprolinase/acetone carboxylase beta subunit
VYGHGNRQAPLEFVNLRMVHVFSLPKPHVNGKSQIGSFDSALMGYRRCYFGEAIRFVETPVYRRTDLPYGQIKAGPAIVQQTDTTTVVYPDQKFFIDPHGNLILQGSE